MPLRGFAFQCHILSFKGTSIRLEPDMLLAPQPTQSSGCQSLLLSWDLVTNINSCLFCRVFFLVPSAIFGLGFRFNDWRILKRATWRFLSALWYWCLVCHLVSSVRASFLTFHSHRFIYSSTSVMRLCMCCPLNWWEKCLCVCQLRLLSSS